MDIDGSRRSAVFLVNITATIPGGHVPAIGAILWNREWVT